MTARLTATRAGGAAWRLRLLFALAALALVLGACKPTAPKPAAPLVEGRPAPVFATKDFSGQTVDIASFRGKVVLINFWATWCPPCRGEIPSLQRLYDTLKGDPSFVMYGVLYKDDISAAKRFMAQGGITFPMLSDPDFVASSIYGLTGVPETYIIDKKGILRKKIIGPAEFDSPAAIAFFKSLLSEAP